MTETLTLNFNISMDFMAEGGPLFDIATGNLTFEGTEGSTAFFTPSYESEMFYYIAVDFKVRDGIIKIKGLSAYDIEDTELLSVELSKNFNTGLSEFSSEDTDAFASMFYGYKTIINGSDDDDYFPFEYGENILRVGGGAGNDEITVGRGFTGLGGSGDDFFTALANNATAKGQGGNDWIVAGGNNTLANGGTGNDIFMAIDGDLTFKGGKGADVFIFDDMSTEVGASEWATKAVIEDFDGSEDVLIFSNTSIFYDGSTSGAETLADLNKNDFMNFSWKSNNGNLILKNGGTRVVLKDTKASDIDLDAFGITDNDAYGLSLMMAGGLEPGSIGETPFGSILFTPGDTNTITLSDEREFDVITSDFEYFGSMAV